MSDERNASGSTILLAFLAGAAAGAVIALLTAPKSGREMRESVSDWARRQGWKDAVARAAKAGRDAWDGTRQG